MFWDTLWALMLGFGLSGVVQAFVSRGEMRTLFGDHRPATLGRASVLGAVSSSCSYAASALAKSLFARGADFTAAMVFMVASTNLVVELGLVLWLLIGWQFTLAEYVGGAIMIILLGLALPRLMPRRLLDGARDRLSRTPASGGQSSSDHTIEDPVGDDRVGDHGADDDGAADDHTDSADDGLAGVRVRDRLRSPGRWADAAGYTISDLTMLRKELAIGFLVAGLLAVAVPTWVWRALFITGHGFWSSLENAVLGPFLALISFVCSVGNIPLAAALWHGGISFGGVVAFVFADLITLPLVLIYRKFYGTAVAVRMLAVFWLVMSAGGLAVEYLFAAVGLLPTRHRAVVAATRFSWNYTTILDIIALALFVLTYWAYRNRERLGGGTGYANDPVCGMQVDKHDAPATAVHAGRTVYFCSNRCQERFAADPDRYLTTTTTSAARSSSITAEHSGTQQHDPVCGMSVIPAEAVSAEYAGQTYYFCGPGCRDAFLRDPEAVLRQPT